MSKQEKAFRQPLAEYRAKVAAGEIAPAKHRNPVERWQEQDTRKSAIAAFCWQCMGGTHDEANGARAAVCDCPSAPGTVNPCPLWHWRPYQ